MTKTQNKKTIIRLTAISAAFILLFTALICPVEASAAGKKQSASLQEKVVAFARSHIGARAGSFGFGGGGWCTKYVNLSMKKAGAANGKVYPKGGLGSSRDFAVYFAKKGMYTAVYKNSSGNVGHKTKVDTNYVPQKGDVVIFARGKNGSINHVGMVYSVKTDKKGNPSKIKVVHGNWSGRVAITTFKAHGSTWGETIVGYGTPNYKKEISLNPGGGTLSKLSVSVTNASKLSSLPRPERDGYSFDGWYTEKNAGERVGASTEAYRVGTDMLYAHWSPQKRNED